MNVTVETITPLQAAEWLGKNDHNRSLKKEVVARLAGAITRGEWAMNGESIKLNGDRLLDGQHRLAAIVQADRPVQSVVVRDVETSAQETIDLGVRRSLSDILRIRGEVNANMLAGALFLLHSWKVHRRLGRTYAVGYPTVQQMLRLLDETPGIRESIAVGQMVKSRLHYPPTLATALHHVFSELNSEDADDFWRRLTEGVNLEEGNPIILLRRFIQEETGGHHTKPNKEKLAAFTVKTWNAYRNGETIRRLRYTPGGAHPETFPVPA